MATRKARDSPKWFELDSIQWSVGSSFNYIDWENEVLIGFQCNMSGRYDAVSKELINKISSKSTDQFRGWFFCH